MGARAMPRSLLSGPPRGFSVVGLVVLVAVVAALASSRSS